MNQNGERTELQRKTETRRAILESPEKLAFDGRDRLLPDDPIPREDLPTNEQLILAEYKLIVKERRFVMTRYIQSLIVYPVIMGYSFKELLAAQSPLASVLFSIFMISANSVYWYLANHFRSMAYHALNRETVIAHRLKLQYPHPMIWGYRAGVSAFVIAYLLVGVILFLKVLHPELLPPAPHTPSELGHALMGWLR